jgi:hypothetical protein
MDCITEDMLMGRGPLEGINNQLQYPPQSADCHRRHKGMARIAKGEKTL